MVSNINEKKINKKTVKFSNNRIKDINKYMKERQIKNFSEFINSLVDSELNKGRTLFNI